MIYPAKKAKMKLIRESRKIINASVEERLRRRAITSESPNTVATEIKPKTPFKKLAKNKEPIRVRIKTIVIERRMFFTIFLSSKEVNGSVVFLVFSKPYFPN